MLVCGRLVRSVRLGLEITHSYRLGQKIAGLGGADLIQGYIYNL